MIFLVFTHAMRRPCWYTKQWHSNSIKFPKYFLHICSVHQHGCRDIIWKPRYHELESHWIPVHETFKYQANQHSEILKINLGGSRKHLNYQSTSYCFFLFTNTHMQPSKAGNPVTGLFSLNQLLQNPVSKLLILKRNGNNYCDNWVPSISKWNLFLPDYHL